MMDMNGDLVDDPFTSKLMDYTVGSVLSPLTQSTVIGYWANPNYYMYAQKVLVFAEIPLKLIQTDTRVIGQIIIPLDKRPF